MLTTTIVKTCKPFKQDRASVLWV